MTTSLTEARLTADLIAMVGIPSVNTFGDVDCPIPAEQDMAIFFGDKLRELGLSVESQEVENGRSNVWGRLKGSGKGPTILLAGHLDTVGVEGYDQPFSAYISEGRIYGRGSCDMKAGLAVYLEVLRQLKLSHETLLGDIIVAGIVDEEHAMLGSAHFGKNGPAVDYAIVAEPSSLAISPAHKGQVCLSISTTGLSVHSSMPELGINAIYHMNAVITALQAYATELSLRKADPLCGHPSFSIGVVRGGQNPSSVPDQCEITIDRRTIPGETCDTVIQELTDILETVGQDIPDFNYALSEPTLNVPPLNTDRASPVFVSMYKAAEQVLGTAPEVVPFPGSTDAPNFAVPAVICGSGALAQCHSLNEYVPVCEMVSAVQIYLATIHDLQRA